MSPATDSVLDTLLTNTIQPLDNNRANWVSYKSWVIMLLMNKAGLKKHLTGRAKCPSPLATVQQPDDSMVTMLEDSKTCCQCRPNQWEIGQDWWLGTMWSIHDTNFIQYHFWLPTTWHPKSAYCHANVGEAQTSSWWKDQNCCSDQTTTS